MKRSQKGGGWHVYLAESVVSALVSADTQNGLSSGKVSYEEKAPNRGATIPRLARNDQCELVGSAGEVLLTKQNQPISQYMIGKGENRRLRSGVVALDDQGNRVYSISQAAQDPNPAAERYPVLSDADLVTLCYPAIDETSRGGKRLCRPRCTADPSTPCR